MPFDGLRVLSLESRRAAEMAALIRKQGGEPLIAPSMREVPLEDSIGQALKFAERLFRGDFDSIVLLTGVGTRLLWKCLLTGYSTEELKAAFSQLTLVARGPKPSAALRDLGLAPDLQVSEPHTWREIVQLVRSRPESRIALQEYGRSNPELIAALRAAGKEVTPVHVYGWALPEDTRPLRDAVAKLIAGEIDVALFTTSAQIFHLLRIGAEEGVEDQVREALKSAFIASIGPTTSGALEDCGLEADFEPSHAKMGLLVNESAQKAAEVLAGKA